MSKSSSRTQKQGFLGPAAKRTQASCLCMCVITVDMACCWWCAERSVHALWCDACAIVRGDCAAAQQAEGGDGEGDPWRRPAEVRQDGPRALRARAWTLLRHTPAQLRPVQLVRRSDVASNGGGVRTKAPTHPPTHPAGHKPARAEEDQSRRSDDISNCLYENGV